MRLSLSIRDGKLVCTKREVDHDFPSHNQLRRHDTLAIEADRQRRSNCDTRIPQLVNNGYGGSSIGPSVVPQIS